MAASVSAADARVAARYTVPGSPTAFAIGSDGNPWYFGALGWQQGLAITKVDITTRKTTTYSWAPVPSCTYCTTQHGRVILNHDGNLYFTYGDDSAEPYLHDSLASVSSSALFQSYGGPGNTLVKYFVSDIANGPDGNVWSVQGIYNCQGGPSCWFSMPPTVVPADLAVAAPLNAWTSVELTTGADGDLWEADNGPYDTPGIMHVDPHTGSVYHRYGSGATAIVAGLRPYSVVAFIVSQTAGTVGYVDFNDRLHHRNLGAAITSSTIAVDHDGSLWAGAGPDLIRLGFNGRVSRVAVATSTHTVSAVTSDAHGNIWYAAVGAQNAQMRGSTAASASEIGEIQI